MPLKVLRDKKDVNLELTLKEHQPSKPGVSTPSHNGDAARHFGDRFLSGLKADVRVDAVPGKCSRATWRGGQRRRASRTGCRRT